MGNQTPTPGSVVPEPGSIFLMASGWLTMGILSRKWKKRRMKLHPL
ncbi:MAG: PEP-CTERM sorting domain-containing protein [Candidatus Scalindua sp.]